MRKKIKMLTIRPHLLHPVPTLMEAPWWAHVVISASGDMAGLCFMAPSGTWVRPVPKTGDECHL